MALIRLRDTLGVTCSSGGHDVISSSDTPSGTRGACPTPCPVSCLSCSAPPSWCSLKWGPGLEVAYVRAEQSEQREVM